MLLHNGTPIAVLLAIFCLVVAVSVYANPKRTQVVLGVALVAFTFIWVGVQDVGGILAGGATDPSSGLLVILLILIYWPLTVSLEQHALSGSLPRVGAEPPKER